MKTPSYHYECKKCGNCCRAGFDIHLRKQDILKWIQAEKTELLQYIQIDPKCISTEGLGGFHIEMDGGEESLGEKFQRFTETEKNDLINFILNNHDYVGEGELPLPIKTFIPGMGNRPILTPHSFEIILKGFKYNIIYILKLNLNTCPLFEDNLCSIHEIKPIECSAFPYTVSGELKVDVFMLKICKGLKKNP